MNNVLRFSPEYLASRHTAALVRHDVEKALGGEGPVVIDLSNVRSISDSYADELFGVLVLQYGLEELFSELSVIGASDRVALAIASAIRLRLEQSAGWDQLDVAQLAARHALETIRLGRCGL